MAKTTLLRVKRRRDEASPPSTLKVAIDANTNTTTKRARHTHGNNNGNGTHVNQLVNLMNTTSLLNQQQQQAQQQQPQSHKRKAIIFRKVTHIPNSRKGCEYNRKHGSKRKSISTSNHDDDNDGGEQNDNENGGVHFNVIDATLGSEGQGSPELNSGMSQHQHNQQGTQHDNREHQHLPPTKRKKISLQMVDSRTMTEWEFWNHIQSSSTTTTDNTLSSSSSSYSSHATSPTTTATTATSTTSTHTSPKITKSKISKSPLKNKKKKNSNIILDPITQMINQSLISLHPGNSCDSNSNINNQDPTRAIMSHMNTIQTNGSSNLRKYINWKCVSSTSTSTSANSNSNANSVANGSTILHMTALLNSTRGADYISTNYSGIIDFDIVDNDGYTARDVAELVGSDGVAQIISSYMVGDDCNSSKKQRWGDRIIDGNGDGSGDENGIGRSPSRSVRDDKKEEREEDYVYDVYCLKDDDDDDEDKDTDEGKEVESRLDESNKHSENGDGSELSSGSWGEGQGQNQRDGFIFNNTKSDCSTGSDPVLVQMRGGVGYWNENGELILETAPDRGDYQSDMDEEEYDSNCEEYDGNDYPDEEAEECEPNGHYNNYMGENYSMPQSRAGYGRQADEEYDSDDDIYDVTGSSEFRNHAVNFRTHESNGHSAMYQYKDDEDDIGDGDYSGFMYGDASRWNQESLYGHTEAYDPDDAEE